MRFTDTIMAIPPLLLIIVFVAVVGPSIISVIVVIGLLGWPVTCRLVRGQLLVLRESEFITAARVVGVPDRTILFRHMLPNILGPLTVVATFGVATAVLLESSLSFLGLGRPAAGGELGQPHHGGRQPGRPQRRCRGSGCPAAIAITHDGPRRSTSSATACATRSIRGSRRMDDRRELREGAVMGGFGAARRLAAAVIALVLLIALAACEPSAPPGVTAGTDRTSRRPVRQRVRVGGARGLGTGRRQPRASRSTARRSGSSVSATASRPTSTSRPATRR